ncbi:WGR domain-containing protein [Myxococcota bacterium]
MPKKDVDTHCPIAKQASIVEDFNCMLNQTNIGHNANKYYVIQLLQKGKQYYVWNRWGRVGEDGQNALKGPFDQAGAEKEFKSKFRSKTQNAWDERATFSPKSGKYMLIEIEGSAESKKAKKIQKNLESLDKTRPKAQVKPSKLPKPTQSLVKLVFDHSVMQGAMAALEIDTNKMPLGQLSKHEVKLGAEVLEELEDALNANKQSKLDDLSSRFYTVIPHSFGRKRPPIITDLSMLQLKKDMLNVLLDIHDALGLHKQAEDSVSMANPLDQQYATLDVDLDPLKPGGKDMKMIEKYLEATCGGRKPKIIDAFLVDRKSEGQRFAKHKKIAHRKLLWHGTNVAVIAPILRSGLRIMPHAGGRVGKGLYLASEQSKSAGYTGTSGRTGIMFLAEAALGKEHHITNDNWRLKAPPKGHDSIVAKGHTEPDPNKEIVINFEGYDVRVPQGKPIRQADFKKSSFSQSEYLVYQESQVRIRYLLKLNM